MLETDTHSRNGLLGTFAIPAAALGAASLVLAIASLWTSFESALAAVAAMLPAIAAVVLAHVELGRAAGLGRTLALVGAGAGYVAVLLITVGIVT